MKICLVWLKERDVSISYLLLWNVRFELVIKGVSLLWLVVLYNWFVVLIKLSYLVLIEVIK